MLYNSFPKSLYIYIYLILLPGISMMKKYKIFALVLCFMVLGATFSSAASSLNEEQWEIVICEERVEEVLSTYLMEKVNNNSDGTVEVFINLPSASSNSISHAQRNHGRSAAIDVSKNHAEVTQEPLLGTVEQRGGEILNQFWLTNSIFAEVPVYELERIAQIPQVQRIHENFAYSLPDPIDPLPGDPEDPGDLIDPSDLAWHLDAINASDVWDEGYTGEGVTVAVLDTGLNPDHDEFSHFDDNHWDEGQNNWHDFVNQQTTPYDDQGHGTGVSALVAGSNVGVAPDAELFHAKVLDQNGFASHNEIVYALNEILPLEEDDETEIDIVVMSLGSNPGDVSETLIIEIHELIHGIYSLGVIPVVASGNYEQNLSEYVNIWAIPQFAFAVGASDVNSYIWEDSMGGLIDEDYPGAYFGCIDLAPDLEDYVKPDFAAPGVDVVSANANDDNSEYRVRNGTSYAAPIVAGTIALMIEAYRDENDGDPSRRQIYDYLRYTATPSNSADDPGVETLGSMNTRCGHGIIDAYDAVRTIAIGEIISPEPGEYIYGDELTVEWKQLIPDGVVDLIHIRLYNDEDEEIKSVELDPLEVGDPWEGVSYTFEDIGELRYNKVKVEALSGEDILKTDSVSFNGYSYDAEELEPKIDELDTDDSHDIGYFYDGNDIQFYVEPTFEIELSNDVNCETLKYDIDLEIEFEGSDGWISPEYISDTFNDVNIGTIEGYARFDINELEISGDDNFDLKIISSPNGWETDNIWETTYANDIGINTDRFVYPHDPQAPEIEGDLNNQGYPRVSWNHHETYNDYGLPIHSYQILRGNLIVATRYPHHANSNGDIFYVDSSPENGINTYRARTTTGS